MYIDEKDPNLFPLLTQSSHPKPKEYPNTDYTLVAFVDSQTGEVLGGVAYDARKYEDSALGYQKNRCD